MHCRIRYGASVKNSVLKRGSPSVLKEDHSGRRRVVPSGLFPNLPYHPRPRTRGPAVPRRKCLILAVPPVTYSPAVPRRPPIVPGVQSPALARFFLTIIYIFLFFFTHWYCSCCRVFGVLPCRFLSTITQSGLIKPEVEIQPNGYDSYQGFNSARVDFAKNFPYRRVLYTRRYQPSGS